MNIITKSISFSFCLLITCTSQTFALNRFDQEVNEIIHKHDDLKNLIDYHFDNLDYEKFKVDVDLNQLLKTDPYLMCIKIESNKLVSSNYDKDLSVRANGIIQALNWILARYSINDCELKISLGDSTAISNQICFAMCKNINKTNVILIPDYDQLDEKYEVLKNRKFKDLSIPFERKINKAFWRGCTAGSIFTPDNFELNFRVQLCKLSLNYPHILDAGFTFYAQGAEKIPELQKYKKNWAKYEEEILHQYLIWIDGNVSSYSASGWRLFTNSCVLKQDSHFTQWYYPLLKPYVHFVPFARDCSDLINQLNWCISNQNECKKIANNCRNFALTHITKAHAYAYLYLVLSRYSNISKDLK